MDQLHNNSDGSDDSGASDCSNDRHTNFKCDGNRPEGKRSRHDATQLNPGPPALYRLNTERKYICGTDRKVRRWTYGRRDRSKNNKVILLVGETGAGNTTMINAMINYLLGVKFEDQEFYQITEETKEHPHQTQSQTSEITVYEAFVEENPISLTIIDTPGYGHTEGYEKDREIAENLTRLFSDKDGIHYIDAVCFVIKASHNRLSEKELYIFHSVLSLFGRDIENNIVFIITHSDGGPPTDAINAINTAGIPCRKKSKTQPIHFLFNNRQKEERNKQCDHLYRSAWEIGERSMNEFFTLLEQKQNRKSVEMTLDVLKERRRLEACVSNLKDQIDEKSSKMRELIQVQEAIRQDRDEIEKDENFEFIVFKYIKEKVPTVNEWWWNSYATCCSRCQENCHERCWWTSDPSQCEVMKNSHCTVCTGKCHYAIHVRENKKFVMNTKKVTMTFVDLKQEYERTGYQNVIPYDKISYENIQIKYENSYEKIKKNIESNMKESEKKRKEEQQLKSDLEKTKNEKSLLLHEAYISIMSLSKIALKADSAFTLQHLDFLIPRLEEGGKDEWMKNLEDLKKTGEEQRNQGALRRVQELNQTANLKKCL